MASPQKPIALTMGEPAGIGGELTIKAWKSRENQGLQPFFAIDDAARLQAIDPDVSIKIIDHPEQASGVFDHALPVLPLELSSPPILGSLNPKNGGAVLDSIKHAVNFCLKGEASALVTNPIHKAVLMDVGFNHPGHTEYVADLCGGNEIPVMMLAAKDLRVVPLTVHVALRDVSSMITKDLICERVRIVNQSLKRDYRIETPRIAVCGLNPHAGENGKFGLEDQEVIAPALEVLKAEGIHVSGPHPADTLFHEEARSRYDIAIGMYHDQALIPLKTVDFHGGVNVTLGLSVVRTSPDHGTALDIAGKGIANPQSLINAIKVAAGIAANRGL
ncbi:MAG TPA: 4-hydroxythreonine-4-phosphate dehydrogenase PdxA [Alphaproteobacteria bacterium]|nr:4-hydroxythreonine-4-phosphate dehydrogenase PdxA [Alphaproteobacteria bacterium]